MRLTHESGNFMARNLKGRQIQASKMKATNGLMINAICQPDIERIEIGDDDESIPWDCDAQYDDLGCYEDDEDE